MNITDSDLKLLSDGSAPLHDEFLKAITIGREKWLDHMRDHYLETYISGGGSKVKVLTGKEGVGKTHLLRSVLADAKYLDYATVYLSSRKCKLNDFVSLYKEIVNQIDQEDLVCGLCRNVASQFIEPDQYDPSEIFVTKIYEQFPSSNLAKNAIQNEVFKLIKSVDLNSSFKAFSYHVIYNRMISPSASNVDIALDWLSGENIDRKDRATLSLFDKLDKTNARDWLNSLIQLLKLSGKKGLVIAIDDLEVITEKSPINNKFIYTKAAVTDICELIRQLIDDTEVLAHCLFLLAGDRVMIEDYNRGFKSYDALWIRLQTGLAESNRFNAFADLVDIDQHLAAQGEDFPIQIFRKLMAVLDAEMIDREDYKLPDDYRSRYSDLQQTIIEAVCSGKSK